MKAHPFILSLLFTIVLGCTNDHNTNQVKAPTSIELVALLDNAYGIKAGSEVSCRGLKIGTVKSLTLSKKGDVVYANLKIKKNIKIPLGSEFQIISQDLLGTKAIGVNFTDTTKFHQTLDTIVGLAEEDLLSVLDSSAITNALRAITEIIETTDSVIQAREIDKDSVFNHVKNRLENTEAHSEVK